MAGNLSINKHTNCVYRVGLWVKPWCTGTEYPLIRKMGIKMAISIVLVAGNGMEMISAIYRGTLATGIHWETLEQPGTDCRLVPVMCVPCLIRALLGQWW